MRGAKKLQGLNLNANPKLSFAGKISYWLKGGMWMLIGYLKRDKPCGNTCFVGASSRRMVGLSQDCAAMSKYIIGHVTFFLSNSQSSIITGPWILSTQTTMQGWVLFKH